MIIISRNKKRYSYGSKLVVIIGNSIGLRNVKRVLINERNCRTYNSVKETVGEIMELKNGCRKIYYQDGKLVKDISNILDPRNRYFFAIGNEKITENTFHLNNTELKKVEAIEKILRVIIRPAFRNHTKIEEEKIAYKKYGRANTFVIGQHSFYKRGMPIIGKDTAGLDDDTSSLTSYLELAVAPQPWWFESPYQHIPMHGDAKTVLEGVTDEEYLKSLPEKRDTYVADWIQSASAITAERLKKRVRFAPVDYCVVHPEVLAFFRRSRIRKVPRIVIPGTPDWKPLGKAIDVIEPPSKIHKRKEDNHSKIPIRNLSKEELRERYEYRRFLIKSVLENKETIFFKRRPRQRPSMKFHDVHNTATKPKTVSRIPIYKRPTCMKRTLESELFSAPSRIKIRRSSISRRTPWELRNPIYFRKMYKDEFYVIS